MGRILTTVFESYSGVKEVVNVIFHGRVAILFVDSAFHRQGHSSIPCQSVVDLWRIKLHWNRLFSGYYVFIPVTIVPPMLHIRILFTSPRRYVILATNIRSIKHFSFDLGSSYDCITSNDRKESWMKTVRKLCYVLIWDIIPPFSLGGGGGDRKCNTISVRILDDPIKSRTRHFPNSVRNIITSATWKDTYLNGSRHTPLL